MTRTDSRLNLARKYRPQALADVVGQGLAVKALSEALKSNRIAPAYIFSGPRGTGKTTCARIFAKAASCLEEKAKDSRPCGACAACKAQASGRYMDIIEIDGASHTGVDDVRSIIESVAFRPSVGARTVYIIDEVHMLSNAAFNALLKTLEEPPAHVLFLMATTEPEKIPATVLSRAHRIEMRRLREVEIVSNLERIVSAEKLKISKEVLEAVATAADGSLRDAQTLLEQLLLMNDAKNISEESVDAFLGTIGSQKEIDFLKAIAAQDLPALLQKTKAFYEQGKDLARLTHRLLIWMRAVLLVKASGKKDLVAEEVDLAQLDDLIQTFSAWSVEDADRLFEILWNGYERLRKSEIPRVALEMTLIRAARITRTEDLKTILTALENAPATIAPSAPQVAPLHSPAPSYIPPPPSFTPPARSAPPSAQATTPKAEPIMVKDVDFLLDAIKRARPSLHAMLICGKADWNGPKFSILFPKGHFAFRQLSEKILRVELEKLLKDLTGGKIQKLEVSELSAPSKSEAEGASPKKPTGNPHFMKEAKDKILQDPDILKAAELLGGEVESVTISGIRTEV